MTSQQYAELVAELGFIAATKQAVMFLLDQANIELPTPAPEPEPEPEPTPTPTPEPEKPGKGPKETPPGQSKK